MGTFIFLSFCGFMILGVFLFIYFRRKKVKNEKMEEHESKSIVSNN